MSSVECDQNQSQACHGVVGELGVQRRGLDALDQMQAQGRFDRSGNFAKLQAEHSLLDQTIAWTALENRKGSSARTALRVGGAGSREI